MARVRPPSPVARDAAEVGWLWPTGDQQRRDKKQKGAAGSRRRPLSIALGSFHMEKSGGFMHSSF